MFSSIRPPSDSDNESSDGDYVPGDDEEDDEDDGFFDSDDAFMETESAFDDMDIEEDLDPDADMEEDVDVDLDVDLWEEEAANASMDNWGLSDGDGSESVSEVEGLAMSGELPAENDGSALVLCSLMAPCADYVVRVGIGAEVYSDSGETSEVLQAPAHETTEPKA